MGPLRDLSARAGVHLYRDTPGMTGVVGHHLIVHTNEAGSHRLAWAERVKARSIEAPAERWRDAIDAVAASDGGTVADQKKARPYCTITFAVKFVRRASAGCCTISA